MKHKILFFLLVLFISSSSNICFGKKKNQPTYSLKLLELTNSKLDSMLRHNVHFVKNEGYDNSYFFHIQAFNYNDSIKLEFSLLEKNLFDFKGALGYLQYEGYNCIVSSQIANENLSFLFKQQPDGKLLELNTHRYDHPILICEMDVFLWIYYITKNGINKVAFFHKYDLKDGVCPQPQRDGAFEDNNTYL